MRLRLPASITQQHFVNFAVLALLMPMIAQAQMSKKADASNTGFAVVELFTSEGCSSCPPAERLAAEISERATKNNENVYVLAFHVDYWDYIGWKDRFAAADYTARQRAYANRMQLRSMYTPQMVINGSDEFVGSNRSRARSSIASALKQEPKTATNIELNVASGQTTTVSYSVPDAQPNDVLHIAVTEDALTSNVNRGENRGRTLNHAGVVRTFHSIPLKAKTKDSLTLELPKDLNRANARVVAYVQDGSAGAIRAATQQPLATNKNNVKTKAMRK